MIKIMNKLYPGKENYKKRNAAYRKVRSITEGIKCLAACSLVSFPFIALYGRVRFATALYSNLDQMVEIRPEVQFFQ